MTGGTNMAAAPESGRPIGTMVEASGQFETLHTSCCIVGGGPGGLVLALLLGRRGVPVILLEAHRDFAREFRGNTLNPASLAIMDELGLADQLLQLRHTKARRFVAHTASGATTFANFERLRTPYRFVAMLPQSAFLARLAVEAGRSPGVQIVMGARAEELIEEGGVVRGVRYRAPDGLREVRAALTVGADGRASRLRRLSGLAPTRAAPTMDVLWFRLPRLAGDPPEAATRFRFGRGCLIALMEEGEHWQIGYIIPAGAYRRVRADGLQALRRVLSETVPEFAERIGALREWGDCSLLTVESARLRRWYRPGLLLIGDAAHPTSPIGGIGINLAIQDAVVAARTLADRLHAGRVTVADLALVQQRRAAAIRLVQTCQDLVQRWVVVAALRSPAPYQLPAPLRLLLRLPGVRDLPTRLIAFGAGPTRLGE